MDDVQSAAENTATSIASGEHDGSRAVEAAGRNLPRRDLTAHPHSEEVP